MLVQHLIATASMLLLSLVSLTGAARGEDYAVVVHPSNPYHADPESMRHVVRQLFLKERTRWPSSNVTVKPFARTTDSEEQQAFLNQVLGMKDSDLANHWISLKQRTGQAAPREVSRDSLLIKLVARYEGGLAVVDKEVAERADSVKILFTFSE